MESSVQLKVYDEQLRPENLIIALLKKGSPLKGNPIRLKPFVNA